MSRATAVSRLGTLLIFLTLPAGCWAACGDTEQDRLVWARERMHPGLSAEQLRLVYQWLVNSTHSCTLSGDLWYYRALVANKLADAADYKYASKKADENGSKSKAQGFDPFLIVSRAPGSPNKIREKWALIIGVNSFKNTDDFLQFSVRDANDLGGYLIESGNFKKSNVTILVDKDATTVKIQEAFGDLRSKAKADDLVLVYFSSHGRPRDLDPTGLSYVITNDTDFSSPGRFFATALKMVELAELGRFVLARDYVLLLDTCFSGAASPGVNGTVVPPNSAGFDPLQGLDGAGNRVVIAASRADERSYEDGESRHGYFTKFLLEALRKDGSSQALSGIFDYLRSHVSEQVGKVDGRQQHPVMQSFGQGQEIILSAPLSAGLRPFQFASLSKP